MKKVLAHGTFDILHYGHINYLEKAKSYGDYLIVFLTSDKLAKIKKGTTPYFNQDIRKRVLLALKCVDEVIIRNNSITTELIKEINVDTFVTIYPKYKFLNTICNVVIVKRTKGISSTQIKKYLKDK